MMRWIVFSLLLVTTACSSRTLKFTTEPPGALVYEDGEFLGQTPLELPFSYGAQREYLVLHDEGIPGEDGRITYKPLRLRQDTETFHFDTFPIDVFVAIAPFKIEDRHEIHLVLEPSDTVRKMQATGDAWVDALLERAETMDVRARRAMQESFPAVEPLKESLEEDSGFPEVEAESAPPAPKPKGESEGEEKSAAPETPEKD